MAGPEPEFGPLQLVVVGFETTERFRGEIARELCELRGRGLIRVLDARLISRDGAGALSEVDLNALIGEAASAHGRPAAHLFGLNGGARANGDGSDGLTTDAFAASVGFALEDLRRLTDEIPDGQHAAVLLIEHLWAARLRTRVRAAGGRLVAQGMLTPEVAMIVGAELQARADAEAAIELADAARGAALLGALETLAGAPDPEPAHDRAGAAAAVVRALVDAGVVAQHDAGEAVDALAQAGIVEQALLQGAVAEAEEHLRGRDAPPAAGPGDVPRDLRLPRELTGGDDPPPG